MGCYLLLGTKEADGFEGLGVAFHAVRRANASRLDGLGARLAVPVLVVYGDDDSYGPSTDLVASRFPSAPHVVLEQCGHLPWIQDAEAFAALLSRFYATVRT